jgi:hypothetical protein
MEGIGNEDIQGFKAEPTVAAVRAGITAFQGISSLQPALLLNWVVSCTREP